MILRSKGDEDGTAISSGDIKSFLDTLNVKYLEEEGEQSKKLPIINILLGLVIIVLSALTITNSINEKKKLKKGTNNNKRSSRNRRGKDQNKRQKTKMSSNHKQTAKQSSKEMSIGKLEYPSEKRMGIIQKSSFVIGRCSEADFRLSENKGISRKHACIQFDGKDYYLMDLNSRNYTFLNGEQLIAGQKKILRNGDEIVLGKEMLYFRR